MPEEANYDEDQRGQRHPCAGFSKPGKRPLNRADADIYRQDVAQRAIESVRKYTHKLESHMERQH